jgi:hypothetical protein
MNRGYFKEHTRYPIWFVLGFTLLTLSPLLVAFFKSDSIRSEMYIVLGVILLVDLLFFSMAIHLRVDNEGIALRFIPFVNTTKIIRWGELSEAKVRKSMPVKEYGGWGYRMKYKKRAYTLYGKWGLELKFKDGKSLFIGIKDHKQLEQLLQSSIYPKYPELNSTVNN